MKYTDIELEEIWTKCVTHKIQQKKEEWFYVINTLNKVNGITKIMEIGACDGGTSLALKNFCTHMVTVDAIPIPKFNLNEFNNLKYKYIGQDSHSTQTFNQVKDFIGDNIDVLFIDGDHTYKGVKQDFEMYSPLVKKGGLIFFHDIVASDFHLLHNCTVSKLWNELESNVEYDTEKFITMTIDEVKHGSPFWGGIGLVKKN